MGRSHRSRSRRFCQCSTLRGVGWLPISDRLIFNIWGTLDLLKRVLHGPPITKNSEVPAFMGLALHTATLCATSARQSRLVFMVLAIADPQRKIVWHAAAKIVAHQ